MRINHLSIRNFRCFEDRTFDFHPQFNLLIGLNGAGKSTVISALSVALSTWLIGIRDKSTIINIEDEDIRLASLFLDGSWELDGSQRRDGRRRERDNTGKIHLAKQFPSSISAQGAVLNKQLSWTRNKAKEGRSTSYGESAELVDLARQTDQAVRDNRQVTLPLIACYGASRFGQEKSKIKKDSQVSGPDTLLNRKHLSRFAPYKDSLVPRISVSNMIAWFARRAWAAFQNGHQQNSAGVVEKAVLSCLEDEVTGLFFDPELGELLISTHRHGNQPFANLSDGQRTFLALVADMAQKADSLNPHLGDQAIAETPGVVLIDELDLHLHPKWQQRVVEDLRRTFPKIQFICTTHSPFLIQSLRSGEELISLDSQPLADFGHLSVDKIAEGVMGVANSSVSLRYSAMRAAAGEYLATLETLTSLPPEQQKAYTSKLDSTSEAFAANPAFQAFLEMKRVATLGK